MMLSPTPMPRPSGWTYRSSTTVRHGCVELLQAHHAVADDGVVDGTHHHVLVRIANRRGERLEGRSPPVLTPEVQRAAPLLTHLLEARRRPAARPRADRRPWRAVPLPQPSGRLKLGDLVQDRPPGPVAVLVLPDRLEFVNREALEPGHDL